MHILLLHCLPFFSICSINRVLILCSGLPQDFLVVSAIAIEFVACVLSPVGSLQCACVCHFIELKLDSHNNTHFTAMEGCTSKEATV